MLKQLYQASYQDLALVVAMIGILMALFVPVPGILLDFLIILNFSFALLMLLITFYSDKPIKFSTFPSLLLMATLFRLALNIAATRLILADAEAGKVIGAIGEYVVGGNYVIGLVVFLILVVVQYVVVTNGAQRVAEVAARFTLDSMPGKQMSIDADLNMGLIDEKTARQRRGDIEREANFYGAMDGSTKFVKGDAIAGIIIILIDIIGGLSIGLAQHGMSWGEALETFTLLTVGDGIVTQIPSLIIAVATGILITRAATDARLGEEVVAQITANPKILSLITIVLLLVTLLPGLPVLPPLVLAFVFGAATWYSLSREDIQPAQEEQNDSAEEVEPESFADLLRMKPIEFQYGTEIAKYVETQRDHLGVLFENLRRQIAQDLGLLVPLVSYVPSKKMAGNTYSIAFHGSLVGNGTLYDGQKMAISPGGSLDTLNGVDAREPAYKLPAKWIDAKQYDLAKREGCTLVNPDTLLITHLQQAINMKGEELLTRQTVEMMIEQVRGDLSGLLDELIPNKLQISDLQSILKELLREGVSIRNLSRILEAIAESVTSSANRYDIVEVVRARLGAQIIEKIASGRETLEVISIAPDLENTLVASIRKDDRGGVLVPDPSILDRLMSSIVEVSDAVISRGQEPVVVCSVRLRRPLFEFCRRMLPALKVLSTAEIVSDIKINSNQMIRV
ncbi:flagellar biosynthesis protein FlhA [Microbulbifer sp. ALW1]|uniref:flagellar biosynthesis protein FlhA n=1 Tax=Microbulbifer sp. (strain ALW1) TaxID=1516059 RepID=UPI00135B37CD|nr:flagellar biosynthesis protein FlhA [Microbulbifer sp. ALW1]